MNYLLNETTNFRNWFAFEEHRLTRGITFTSTLFFTKGVSTGMLAQFLVWNSLPDSRFLIILFRQMPLQS